MNRNNAATNNQDNGSDELESQFILRLPPALSVSQLSYNQSISIWLIAHFKIRIVQNLYVPLLGVG